MSATPTRYPALVFITNTHKAVWLSAQNQTKYSELATFDTPKAVYSDKEAYFKSGPRGTIYRTGTSLDVNGEFVHETRAHLLAAARKTREMLRGNNSSYYFVAVPAKLKDKLDAHLRQAVKKKPVYILGNFIHRSEYLKLLKKIHTIPLPIIKTARR